MSLADIVTDQPQELQRVGALVKFPSGLEVHRVDDKVRMYMISITVGGNQDFRTGPRTDSKFQSNFMSLLGGDVFLGREGLDILIESDAVHFAMGCLGSFKLQNGIPPIAVDAADEIPL